LAANNLPAPSPPERGDPEVEKDRHNHGGDQKHPVVGAVRPTGSHAPEVWSKDNHRQKEKDARDFEPDNAANAPEGAQKATDATRHASAGLDGGLPGGLDPNCRVRKRLGLMLGLLRGCGLCRGRQALASHAAGNTQSRAKDAADCLWSHSIYDGSSDVG
jgi:hypothetical protein